jgi:hypothetical protein
MKISIRKSTVQIDFEGSQDEYEQLEITNMFWRLVSDVESSIHTNGEGREDIEVSGTTLNKPIDMSIRAMCNKLSVNSGSDLFKVAACYLSIVKGQERFDRKDLTACVREASGFFKETYAKNASSYIETLIKKGVLLESSSGHFSLSNSAEQEALSSVQ